VIFRALGAPRRHLLGGRRPKRAAAPSDGAAEPVPVTRVTAVAAEGFESGQAAEEWLGRCRSDAAERDRQVGDALAVVNRMIHAHRLAASDPYVSEVSRERALAVRLGYGSGDELVEGRFRAAYDLPPAQQARRAVLAPQEELARIVGGRRPAFASEDLALRARLDLEQGRSVQAALQLEAALVALDLELRATEGADTRLTELTARRARVRELAAGLEAGESQEELASLADALERELRRRRYREESAGGPSGN
jgi:hypothetical protein